MENLIENLGKLAGLLLAFFGVGKALQWPLSRRVKTLEDRSPARTEAECLRLMSACPVAVKLQAQEKTLADFARWMERIEAKLDRVIEGRHQ